MMGDSSVDENDPRIKELETVLYKFPMTVNVDVYLKLAESHREGLEIDLDAARLAGNHDLVSQLLSRDKTVLSNMIRLRRTRSPYVMELEKDMKPLPRTLHDVNTYLEIALEHQQGLQADLASARGMCYNDLCSLLEKTEKTVQSNIGKLRRHRGKLEKLAQKRPTLETAPEVTKRQRTTAAVPPPAPPPVVVPPVQAAIPPPAPPPVVVPPAQATVPPPAPPPVVVPPAQATVPPPAPPPVPPTAPSSTDMDVTSNAGEQNKMDVDEEDDVPPVPPANPSTKGKSSRKGKKETKKKIKAAKGKGSVPNPADLDGLIAMEPKTESGDQGMKGETSDDDDDDDGLTAWERHQPNEWEKLKVEVQRKIMDDVEDEYELHRAYNLPLSTTSRSWARRHQGFMAEAAYRSKRMAAHCFIGKKGRTTCHYHTVYDKKGKINDVAVQQTPQKPGTPMVTGVPFERQPKPLLHPSYLARNPGQKPTSMNRNFTLERVLRFFPVVDGVHTMHCGCLLDDALIDFYFWKRVVLYSQSQELEEPYRKPMKPHDRLYLITALSWIEFDVNFLYSYNERGMRQTEADRLEAYMKRLGVVTKELRNTARGREKKVQGKKKLEYVEVPEGEEQGDSFFGSSDDDDGVRSPRDLQGNDSSD
ncbi:hypothetical protein MD484_g8857, partial [Candolleomyces efflorescens]